MYLKQDVIVPVQNYPLYSNNIIILINAVTETLDASVLFIICVVDSFLM